MIVEDISRLETSLRKALGIDVRLEAARGLAAPRRPWPGLQEETARFGDPARAASWRRGRAALEALLERLRREWEGGAYAGPGAGAEPVRFPHPFLSLTHTGDWAIAAGTRPGAALGIGVDLELRTGMKDGAERFFLGPEETRWLLAQDDPAARGRERVRLWTVKEALYKANPANPGTLLGHYLLEDPAATAGAARWKGDDGQRLFRYACVDVDPGALTVAVCLRGREA